MVFNNKRVQSNNGRYKANNKYKKNNNFKGKGRKEINKKTKVHLVFDNESRRDFLEGFQKRKQERKAYHKARLEKQLIEEKHRIRKQAKQTVGKLSSSHYILPELEGILSAPEESTKTYDVGNVTVSITSLDEAIHQNVPEFPESDDKKEDDAKKSEEIDSDLGDDIQEKLRSVPQGKNIRSVLNKETNRILQQSKAYKASQKLKQKSRKFKGKNRRNKEKSSGTDAPAPRDHNSKRKGGKKNLVKGRKPRK